MTTVPRPRIIRRLLFPVGLALGMVAVYLISSHGIALSTAGTTTQFSQPQDYSTTLYSVSITDVLNATEYRFFHRHHHFLTLIDQQGTQNFRPHPGCDVNGWGSSWYAQPFLPGAVLSHTVVQTPIVGVEGITVTAQGNVSHGSDQTYGDWGMFLTFSFDPDARVVTATGEYSLTLDGPLDVSTGDLNLYRIASNYLDDVYLLSGGMGDTGDMEKAEVTGDNWSFTWIPPDQPAHFPGDTTDMLAIEVVGTFNEVDTDAQGYAPIVAAFKPDLTVVLSSTQPGSDLTFGGLYTLVYSQTFWEDNVGITPLIRQPTSQTFYDFEVGFTSEALEKCTYLPIMWKDAESIGPRPQPPFER